MNLQRRLRTRRTRRRRRGPWTLLPQVGGLSPLACPPCRACGRLPTCMDLQPACLLAWICSPPACLQGFAARLPARLPLQGNTSQHVPFSLPPSPLLSRRRGHEWLHDPPQRRGVPRGAAHPLQGPGRRHHLQLCRLLRLQAAPAPPALGGAAARGVGRREWGGLGACRQAGWFRSVPVSWAAACKLWRAAEKCCNCSPHPPCVPPLLPFIHSFCRSLA